MYGKLYAQVLGAIALGVAIGYFYPGAGESPKPLGDAFIKLVKMIIAPVIFLTIATGIAGMNDLHKVGRVAGKAMVYFLTFSTLALIVGLIVANVVQPGAGLNVDPASLDVQAVNTYAARAHEQSVTGFLMNIIPSTIVGAFAEGDILQVLFFSVLFGMALAMVGETSKPVVCFLQALIAPVFKLVGILMKAAGEVCRYNGFSIFSLIRYIKEELLFVLATSSSEAALPSLMQKMEKAGARRSIVGLVIPAGYSFNLDGTNIYMTLAAPFIAQATNTDLSIGGRILLVLFAMLPSKGADRITGAGFVTLAVTLFVVPTAPFVGMTLILSVDDFMFGCRALTNLLSNAVGTLVVARGGRAG